MSDQIPQETIDVFRQVTNVSVDTFGIPCVLFIQNNNDAEEFKDIYQHTVDRTYTEHSTKVWVEWSINKHRLRKMGFFTEEESPMVAWFSNTVKDTFGNETDIDITIGSYFSIPIQYIPSKLQDTEYFQIVDIISPASSDMVALKYFKIAPLRAQG